MRNLSLKGFSIFFSLLSSLFLNSFLVFDLKAQTIHNYFPKSIDLLRAGKYEKVLENIEKEQKKISEKKKIAPEILSLAEIWAVLLKTNLAESRGSYPEMAQNIRLLKPLSEKLKTQNYTSYTLVMTHIADIYLQYGSPREASELLTQIQEVLQKENVKDSLLLAEVATRTTQALLQTGNLKKANQNFAWLLPFWKNKLNKKTNYLKNTEKPTSNDISYREQQYARMLTYATQLTSEKGDYNKADTLFEVNSKIIKKIVGSKTPEYNQFLLLKGLNNEQTKSTEKMQKTFLEALQTTKPSHHLNLKARLKVLQHQTKIKKSKDKKTIQTLVVEDKDDDKEDNENDTLNVAENTKNTISLEQKLEDSLANNAKPSKNKIKEVYEKTLLNYHKPQNIYKIEEEILQVEKLLAKQKKQQAKEMLANLLMISSDILPENHPLRLNILTKLFALHNLQTAEDITQAKKEMTQMVKIHQDLYGNVSQAPLTARMQIQEADFLVKNTSELPNTKVFYALNPAETVLGEIIPTHKKYAEIQSYLIDYYTFTESYDNSLKYIESLEKQLLKQYSDKKNTAFGLFLVQKANYLTKKGDYTKSLETIEEASKILRKKAGRNSMEYAAALLVWSNTLAQVGAKAEADKLLRQTAKIIQKNQGADASIVASGEVNAQIALMKGNFGKAEKTLTQVMKGYENKFGAQSMQNISALQQLMRINLLYGKYDQTSEIGAQLDKNIKKTYGENTLIYANYLQIMADYYQHIHSFKKAEQLLEKSLDIKTTVLGAENAATVAVLIEKIALNAQINPKNISQGIEILENRKTKIKENLGEKNPLYATFLKQLSILYLKQDSLASLSKAQSTLLEAENVLLDDKNKKNLELGNLKLLQGEVAFKTKNYTEAQTHYEKAGEIYKKIFDKKHPFYLKSQSKLAKIAFIQNAPEKAYLMLKENLNSYLEFVEKFFPVMSATEKEKYWASMQPDFEFFNLVATTTASATTSKNNAKTNINALGEMYNYALSSKGLLLKYAKNTQESIMNIGQDSLVYQQWISAKEQLAPLLNDYEENEKEILKLSEKADNLEKQLSQNNKAFQKMQGKTGEKNDWKTIQKRLQKNQIALEIVRFRANGINGTDSVYYAGLILSPKTIENPVLVLFDNGREMEDMTIFFKNKIRFKAQKDKFSYKKLWEKIDKEITKQAGKDAKNQVVFFSPDGLYHEINVSALQNGTKYVFDYQEIVYLTSTNKANITDTTLLLTKSKEVKSNFKKNLKKNQPKEIEKQENKTENQAEIPNIYLIGNPLFYPKNTSAKNKDIKDLQGTQKEIDKIQAVLLTQKIKSEQISKEDATEEKLKKVQNPTILHIATHGFFDAGNKALTSYNSNQIYQNPLLYSGLLMSNAGELFANENKDYQSKEGILTAQEALFLPLTKTQLVVLSACETGAGANATANVSEGIYGLQRAFLIAGAQTVVFSLFKVDDEITQKMMVAFYKKLLKHQSKSVAFREAQKEIKAQYPAPIHWGAFNMINGF